MTQITRMSFGQIILPYIVYIYASGTICVIRVIRG